MDYVVTYRFHGVIFAHLLNKPILAVARHPKAIELMAGLDLKTGSRKQLRNQCEGLFSI